MTASATDKTVILPIKGTCHCGAVSYEMHAKPKYAVECNCSACRRLGTVWGHGEAGEITVSAAPDATIRYIQGDRTLAFVTCKTCGCTTHWESVSDQNPGRMAVNLRLAAPGTIEAIGLRHFDGADTWEFLD